VTLFRTGERREEDRNTKWMLVGSVTAGIGLRARAIVGLSRSFHRDIQVAQDQLVVRAGPYAAVRHLAYAGNLLMLAGLGVADGAS
jgi:protein-S-isoprenylcysteine O-methyltransferase Ste14